MEFQVKLEQERLRFVWVRNDTVIAAAEPFQEAVDKS